MCPQRPSPRPSGRWSAPAEVNGVIDPDVLWSCTTCGACVEQCPVDIEHVDHIVDMRRYQVLIESEFPSELGGTVQEPGEERQPVGGHRIQADGLGGRPAVRGPSGRRRRRVARRGRVAVLGRLRRRVRGPGEEDHPGRGRAAAHGGRLVRGARRRRDVHRRSARRVRATSSCSRCWPSRTSRCCGRARPRRSWPPARTASTR